MKKAEFNHGSAFLIIHPFADGAFVDVEDLPCLSFLTLGKEEGFCRHLPFVYFSSIIRL